MALPSTGWLTTPQNRGVNVFTLPEEYQVFYYVCNPGPYDPLQLYEKPIIEYIQIEQLCFADAGWKRGAWGWVAGIHWRFAYGDALIDAVYPPLEPNVFDENCPGDDDVETETCPSDTAFIADTAQTTMLLADGKTSTVITDEPRGLTVLTTDARVTPVITPDADPV